MFKIKTKNNSNVLIIIVFILSIIIISIFEYKLVAKRERIFYDEMISFQRSSEMFSVSERTDWENIEKYINQSFSGADFTDNLSVNINNSILHTSPRLIVKRILGSNVYELLLNLIVSIRKSGFNIRDIALLNIILSCTSLLLVFFITKNVIYDSMIAILSTLITGLSLGFQMIYGYYRFYALHVIFILAITFVYLYLLDESFHLLKDSFLLLLTLLFTWLGYHCSQYTFIYAGFILVGFLCLSFKNKNYKRFILFFLTYVVGAGVFLIKNYSSFVSKLQYGKTDTTHMSQFRIAVDNLLNRSWDEFVYYFKIYFRSTLRYSTNSALLWVGIVLLLFTLCIIKRRIIIDRKVVLIFLSTTMSIIMISKIAPWPAWRYTAFSFPLFSIVFVSVVYTILKDTKTYKIVILFVTFVSVLSFIKNYESVYYNLLDTDGPNMSDRSFFAENYNQTDGIYFYDGDNGTLYYGAFAWPQEGNTYITTKEDFDTETDIRNKILAKDELLVWVSYKDYEEDGSDILKKIQNSGFNTVDEIRDMGEIGRHIVFLCKR